MIIILRFLIAILLIGHGVGHVMGFVGTWTNLQPFDEPAFNENPWILSDTIFIHSGVGKIFGVFWLIAVIAYFAAAIGIIANQSWWSTLAIIASIISLIAVIAWWNTFTPGIMSKKSAVAVDIIILVALLGPWKDMLLAKLSSG